MPPYLKTLSRVITASSVALAVWFSYQYVTATDEAVLLTAETGPYWESCMHISVKLAKADAAKAPIVDAAVTKLRNDLQLDIHYEGVTDEVFSLNWLDMHPGEVIVAWLDKTEYPWRGPGNIGNTLRKGPARLTSAMVAINADRVDTKVEPLVVLHELAHAVGANHVDIEGDLMATQVGPDTTPHFNERQLEQLRTAYACD